MNEYDGVDSGGADDGGISGQLDGSNRKFLFVIVVRCIESADVP